MDCRGVLDVMSDYLEGEAGEDVCKEVEDHLLGCKKCRMHVDVMKKVITLYKKWRDDPMPNEVSTRLQHAFARECVPGFGYTPDKEPGSGRQSTRRKRD